MSAEEKDAGREDGAEDQRTSDWEQTVRGTIVHCWCLTVTHLSNVVDIKKLSE